ncbi:MAG: SsrA-binding protein SmpB [Thermoflexales bacterium]|nr:SsrA-binding protein SmpB [Thermoflexales bacterium]
MSKTNDSAIKIVASNRRATFDYALETRYEAGIVLTGGEIKSVRAGKMDLRDAFVQVRDGEAWLINAYIPAYDLATGFARAAAQTGERRDRKLLLHKREILELARGVERKGYTAIATKAYLKRGRAKVEIALAKGKKLYDKRQAVAKRDADREIQRALRERY